MTLSHGKIFRKQSGKKRVSANPDFLSHCHNHYELLEIATNASDSTTESAYSLKASRGHNKNSANISVSEGIPGKAVKILRHSVHVDLNSEERKRFDSGKSLLECCAECGIYQRGRCVFRGV